jgi:phosphatidate cytidylyltransferase
VILFASVAATMLWLLLSGTLDSAPMPNASATMLGVVYVGLMGSYAGLILRERHGVSTMFTLALCTVGYDVVGLLAGSAVGRSPLIRWVSPNKTVEGLLAGMAAAFGLACLMNIAHVAPWNDKWIHTIQLGLTIAVAAPIGDLVESMLKRSLGVKDMGDLLPGHGGVLDRFDAFLFVLPSVYYLGLLLNVPVGIR